MLARLSVSNWTSAPLSSSPNCVASVDPLMNVATLVSDLLGAETTST